MPGFLGRTVILNWNGAKIAGVREKTLNLNGEPIDVSDDDSSGFREILDAEGEKMIDLDLSGVTKDTTLKEDWFAGTRKQPVTITYADGGVISGDFYLASYSETGPYKDATTFQAQLQSTGSFEYAAPSGS